MLEEAVRQQEEDLRVAADRLFALTGGGNLGGEDVSPLEDFGLSHKKYVSQFLKRLKSRGYLEFQKRKEKPYSWTLAARKIKEVGKLFFNEWPGKLPEIEKTEPRRLRRGRDEGRTTVQPLPLTDIHGPLAGIQVSSGEAPGEDVVAIFKEIPMGLPPLFLTLEEIPVFQLLAEVSEDLLSLDFFDGLGLGGASLDLFLAKMCQLGILANGPEVMRQEKVFTFNRSAYDQCKGSIFQVNSSAALEKIRADLKQLKEEQAHLSAERRTREGAVTKAQSLANRRAKELQEARNRTEALRKQLAEAEAQESEAERVSEGAASNYQAAESALTAVKQEIAASDFDGRISKLEELEVTAKRLEMLHPLAYQQLLLSYLISPLREEAG